MKECQIGGPRVGVGPSLLASRKPVYSIPFPARIEKHSGPLAGRHSLKSASSANFFPVALVLLTAYRETLVSWTSHQQMPSLYTGGE
jgi:hypothetical protein